MSAKRCTWAAKNGVKNAVRVALRFDDRAERLERIVNGSANTNDNTIFRELLVNIKRGAILVFDAGFNKLSIIRELASKPRLSFCQRQIKDLPSANGKETIAT